MADGARWNGLGAPREAGPGRPYAQFGVDVYALHDSTVVAPHGELDALNAPLFGAVLDALSARGVRVVVIDLSDVRSCNAAALRTMAELAARLHLIEGRVRIVAPTVLDRMLELADLRFLFELDDPDADEDAASVLASQSHRPVQASRSLRPRMSSPHRLATEM
jgi:anti-anti-sigma factor